jgi:hypothetical protein
VLEYRLPGEVVDYKDVICTQLTVQYSRQNRFVVRQKLGGTAFLFNCLNLVLLANDLDQCCYVDVELFASGHVCEGLNVVGPSSVSTN